MNSKKQDTAYEERRAFFDERAPRWMDTFYRDPATGRMDRHRDQFTRLFQEIPVRRGDRVLDVGCGPGVLVPHLLERVESDGLVFELDYAPRMIAVNRELHPDPRVRFIVADVKDIPLEDAACEVVICYACFPHFDDKPLALAALSRVLKEGGSLSVAHFHSSREINDHHRKAGTPVMHDQLPEAGAMRGLFEEAGFAVRRLIDEPGFYLLEALKPPVSS